MRDYIVIDIETTGLSACRHKITEIAALKYRDSHMIDEFVTLINPEVRIPSFITRLTGIDNEMVKSSPKIAQILPELASFIQDFPFVAHNATFDYNFIDHTMAHHMGRRLNNPKICTCRLAKRLVPYLPSKRLSALCSHFEIVNHGAHRAKEDAMVTAQIFGIFTAAMHAKGIKEIDDICRFQGSRIIKT